MHFGTAKGPIRLVAPVASTDWCAANIALVDGPPETHEAQGAFVDMLLDVDVRGPRDLRAKAALGHVGVGGDA
jgi:hypothetical protein